MSRRALRSRPKALQTRCTLEGRVIFFVQAYRMLYKYLTQKQIDQFCLFVLFGIFAITASAFAVMIRDVVKEVVL